MRIAFISTVRGYRWAGSEELWYEAALQALADGHQVSAYIHEELQAADQIRDLAVKGASVRVRRTFRYVRLWPMKEKIAPTFPLGELERHDVLLVSLGSLLDVFYLPGLLAALQFCRKPYVLFCQFNAESLAFAPVQRSALRKLVAHSAGCGFVSRHNLMLAERQLAMKLPVAKVIGNPVRAILPGPLPWPAGDSLRMACVARLETLWKGQDLLLEVLSRPPWTARDWKLSFFGEGPDREHLENAVKFYGLENRVVLRGYVRDLQDIWRDHHVMTLPSRGEGLPLAILEAMMCGRPTITTDVGGNREILDESTGFIAEAATLDSFGKTLEQAWNAREIWAQMGLAAHRRAQEVAANNPARQLLEYLTTSIGNVA